MYFIVFPAHAIKLCTRVIIGELSDAVVKRGWGSAFGFEVKVIEMTEFVDEGGKDIGFLAFDEHYAESRTTSPNMVFSVDDVDRL